MHFQVITLYDLICAHTPCKHLLIWFVSLTLELKFCWVCTFVSLSYQYEEQTLVGRVRAALQPVGALGPKLIGAP